MFYSEAHFGEGTGPIWLDEVICSPGITNLSQCLHNGYNVTDCTHREDASVSCAKSTSEGERRCTCISNDPLGCIPRIVPMDYEWEGLVEVRQGGEWRAVCDDNWDVHDAEVVCRALQYSVVLSVAMVGKVSAELYWFDGLACTGREKSLCVCPMNFIDPCIGHNEGAVIACGCKYWRESEEIKVCLFLRPRSIFCSFGG